MKDIIILMFNDSQFRQGGTNLGCFPVGGGGGLTTPTSPPVYGPGMIAQYPVVKPLKGGPTVRCDVFRWLSTAVNVNFIE